MDFTSSTSPSKEEAAQDHYITNIEEDQEKTCWGCGIRLLVSPYAPIFRCGWCGSITNKNELKSDNQYYKWRRSRDRCFVVLVSCFLYYCRWWHLAIYPVVFSISIFCGIFASVITAILSMSTLSSFSITSFISPGASSRILWGSYPTVGKGGLCNYTFCHYCSKPKSSRTHHCPSCGMCVLDMDHHCPFKLFALVGSAILLTRRGLFLVYLFIASVSVGIALFVLLWQQLCYIYRGKTYLSQLSASETEDGEKDCKNFIHFFGCQYIAAKYFPVIWNSTKTHKK